MTKEKAEEICSLINERMRLSGGNKFKTEKSLEDDYVIYSRQILICAYHLHEISKAMNGVDIVWSWYIVADKQGCIDIYIKEGV